MRHRSCGGHVALGGVGGECECECECEVDGVRDILFEFGAQGYTDHVEVTLLWGGQNDSMHTYTLKSFIVVGSFMCSLYLHKGQTCIAWGKTY